MKCFLPWFAARHKRITCRCDRGKKHCSCQTVIPNSVSNIMRHEYKMAPLPDIPEDAPCIPSTVPLSDHELRSTPQCCCNGDKFKAQTKALRKLWLHGGPVTPKAYILRKSTTEKVEVSYHPEEGFHDWNSKLRRAETCSATGRDHSYCSRQTETVGISSMDVQEEKSRQAHVRQYREVTDPVVCIVDNATHTPVVHHKQLFAIMKKKPGWMIIPQTHSAGGWVIFQHWNKNRCDAKARLPYPNLRIASPEILDSFVQIVNQQQQREDFNLLSSSGSLTVLYRPQPDAVKVRPSGTALDVLPCKVHT